MVSSDGGRPALLTRTPDVDEFRPAFSADGKQVYYRSGKTGRNEIWALDIPSGASTQLTHGGGENSIPSQDGRWIYYNREGGLWRVAVRGGGETKISDGVPTGLFAVASNRIYVLRPGANSVILEIDPDTRRSRVHYTFPYPIEPYTYPVQTIAVAPGGREMFVQHRVREDSDLVLLENFR